MGWIFLIAALLGALVGIDGLMKGEILRPLAGWAAFALFGWMTFWGVPYLTAKLHRKIDEQMARAGHHRSWPLVFGSAVFGLTMLACAIAIVSVPFEALVDWSRRSASLVQSLEDGFGQAGARVALATLFLVASGAAFWGAWVWYQAGSDKR